MEKHFVNDEAVRFKIDGLEFAYKPVTAGQENDWANEYYTRKNGQLQQDLSKLNECKVRNLVSVPYTKELIGKLIGTEKEWQRLDQAQKWKLLRKLKPTVFNQIIMKINEIDNPVKKKD